MTTIYKWFVGWNFPGCLPDNPAEEFDNEKEAREYLYQRFCEFAQEDSTNAGEFGRMADEMEFHNADALAFGGDSYFDGPDGMVYFIECHDVTDDKG